MGYPILKKSVELDSSPSKVESYTLSKEELKYLSRKYDSTTAEFFHPSQQEIKRPNITKAQLAAELREGTPIEDISKLYDLKRSTIVTYIKRWNLKTN